MPPWGPVLQTWRGCYAKAIEHSPVLQVGLDKCSASVDWQIQFALPYCRRGPVSEQVRSDYIWHNIEVIPIILTAGEERWRAINLY